MKRQSPTLAEVANAAGVSQMTASRALNNRMGVSRETREEILRIAAEMGYVLNRTAQKLSGGHGRIIGLITTELHNPFVSELVTGAGRAARTFGYELLVYSLLDPDQQPPGTVLHLMRQIADGVIALLPYEFGYLQEISATHVPIVTVDHVGESASFPSIAADSYSGGCAAVRHLVDLGHRRIAFVTGDERLASARDRHRAYRETLAMLGIPRDPALVVRGDFTSRSGGEAVHKLLALSPTAIFAANDLTAIGAIAALHEAGLRVPDDVSVVGFDDIPAASHVHPALTTVRQPMERMGRSAVNTLLALLAGLEAPAEEIILPTELIVRRSTGPAPAADQKTEVSSS